MFFYFFIIGGRLANASSFPSSLFQPSSVRQGSSFDDADFFHREILPNGKTNQTNGFHNTMFEARPPSSNPGLNSFEEESRFWLLMQQSASAHQDSSNNFSQIFAPQIQPSQQDLSFSNLQSRLVDEHQNRDHLSFFSQMPKQQYANGNGNGHVSNTNGGYMHNMNQVQLKGEVGLTAAEVERNGRLGVNYFSGYGGDLMFSSRVYGL